MRRKGKHSGDGPSPSGNEKLINFPRHSIAVYTVLFFLLEMKRTLGLEATLEYADKYIRVMDKKSPRVRRIVESAASKVNVKRMYRRVCDEGKV